MKMFAQYVHYDDQMLRMQTRDGKHLMRQVIKQD